MLNLLGIERPLRRPCQFRTGDSEVNSSTTSWGGNSGVGPGWPWARRTGSWCTCGAAGPNQVVRASGLGRWPARCPGRHVSRDRRFDQERALLADATNSRPPGRWRASPCARTPPNPAREMPGDVRTGAADSPHVVAQHRHVAVRERGSHHSQHVPVTAEPVRDHHRAAGVLPVTTTGFPLRIDGADDPTHTRGQYRRRTSSASCAPLWDSRSPTAQRGSRCLQPQQRQ